MADRDFRRMTIQQLEALDPSTMSDDELQRAAQAYDNRRNEQRVLEEARQRGGVDTRRGAPWQARLAIGAAPPEGRLPTAERLLPNVQQFGDTMIYDEPGSDAPREVIPSNPDLTSAGNIAGALPEIATIGGSALAAVPRMRGVERVVAPVARGVLRAMRVNPDTADRLSQGAARVIPRMGQFGVGAAAGQYAAEEAGRAFGTVDERPTSERIGDLAATAGENAALYGGTEAAMAALARPGRFFTNRLLGGGQGPEAFRDATELGVRPTAGMVGNPMTRRIEEDVAGLPGGSPTRAAAGEAAADAEGFVQRGANALDRAQIGVIPEAGGTAARGGIDSWRDQFRTEGNRLFGEVENAFPPGTPINVTETYRALLGPADAYAGAPNLGRVAGETFRNEATQLRAALRQDLIDSGAPANQIDQMLATGNIPREALSAFRTEIGEQASNRALIGDPKQRFYADLYAAITRDLRNAASALPDGGRAITAWDAANDHWRGGMENIRNYLGPLAREGTPAQSAFQQLMGAGADIAPDRIDTIRTLIQSADPRAWNIATATKLREIGLDGNRQWNPQIFMNNVRRLEQAGSLRPLLDGTPQASLARDLPRLANLMESTARVNRIASDPPSIMRAIELGTLFGLAGGATGGGLSMLSGDMTHSEENQSPLTTMAEGAAGALILGPYMVSRLLQHPSFVRWMANVPNGANVGWRQTAAHLMQLGNLISAENDPENQTAMRRFGQAVLEQAQQRGIRLPGPLPSQQPAAPAAAPAPRAEATQ